MASKKSSKNKKLSDTKISMSNTSDSDDTNSDNEKVIVPKNKKVIVEATTIETIEDNSDENSNISESDSDSDSEENHEQKTKEKKIKESFCELTTRLEEIQINIKAIDKDICESQKIFKLKEKNRNDLERQRNSILKILFKTHTDEIIKVRKAKTKRKTNSNSGFNKEQPIPPILLKFLGLEQDINMTRPKVGSAMHNKFKDLGLKTGQIINLDKETIKALELDKSWEGKSIGFGEFQKFLKSFYITKEIVNSVALS